MTRNTWRGEAIVSAHGHYANDVVDGTPEGNVYIGTKLFALGGNPVDVDYRNGKTAWCGRFVEAVFRPLGFRFSLDSVGRVLSYGLYNSGNTYHMGGAPDHCRDAEGNVWHLADYHLHMGGTQGRAVFQAWTAEYKPRPGDIALHQDAQGSWHGHVMMVLGADEASGDITVIEGNHSQTIGPRGNKRDGIGTRVIEFGDHYLSWIVVPSDIDFDPTLEIGTKAQMEVGNG